MADEEVETPDEGNPNFFTVYQKREIVELGTGWTTESGNTKMAVMLDCVNNVIFTENIVRGDTNNLIMTMPEGFFDPSRTCSGIAYYDSDSGRGMCELRVSASGVLDYYRYITPEGTSTTVDTIHCNGVAINVSSQYYALKEGE